MKFIQKKKQLICFLLVFFMVCSGLGMDHHLNHMGQTVSWMEQSASFVSGVSYTLSSQDACTTEILGLQNVRQFTQSRARSERTDLFSVLILLSHLALLLDLILLCLKSTDGYALCITYSHRSMMQYIHHQDGQKG